jgi:hypothetical protein
MQELESPVTWVVFSHTEIPIVALMTTVFLGRRLSNVQWVSVILLVDGASPSCHARRCLRRMPATMPAVCEGHLSTQQTT